MTVASLAADLSLTPNAVRRHLRALRIRGAVLEHVEERTIRGRPRLLYELAPVPPGNDPNERLARLLAEVVATRRTVREVGRAAAGGPPLDDIGILEAVRAEGFEPRFEDSPEGFVLVLQRCPFAAAATTHPGVVCSLHRGTADALAERAGRVVTSLEVRDPVEAGCRITFSTASSQ